MLDVIPGAGHIVFVSATHMSTSTMTKTRLRRIMRRPPKSHGGDRDAVVEMEVAEEFPKDAGPYLKRLYEESDEGVVTRKLERFITKMDNFLDERGRKGAVALMVKKMVSNRSGTRKYLTKKIAEQLAKLAMEAVEKGKEILHVDVEVDIGYSEVDLDNLP